MHKTDLKKFHYLVPMESCTTQKLSFLPVSILPKEYYPWAQRTKFKPPTEKMESETTQKLSYQRPGHYIADHDCPCELNNSNPDLNNCPRAAIYLK